MTNRLTFSVGSTQLFQKKINTHTNYRFTTQTCSTLMEISLSLLATLCIVSLAFVSSIIYKHQSKQRTPPGPKPWPIIGNLNLIGPLPHQSLHLLSQKYGEIMRLKFGKFPVVVASSPEMAKEFLKTHDSVFASRPPLAAGKYIAYNYSDVGLAPYGPHWRQARKIYLTEVFNAKTLDFYEHIRIDERRNLLSRLHALSGKPIMLRDHLVRYSLSVCSRMVLSNKYFSESKNEDSIVTFDELHGMLNEWFLLSGVFNMGDWIPWLDFLDLQGYIKRMKVLSEKFDKFFNYVIDDHQARRIAKKDFVPQDLVDVLLELAENPDLEVELTRNRVKGLVLDLIAGGTDTGAASVEWAIHEIIKQPRVIEKAKEELDRVIGRDIWVEEGDLSRLPYIDAIIMETMRLHPLTTLLAPHYALEDCNVSGYDISKGTTIFINTWSMGRDPKIWDSPREFLPERFMGKEIDVLISNFALLPFGSGRRSCPGYKLGLKMVRSTLANLLHGFNFRLTEGMVPEDVCMDEVFGLTTHPKVPLTLVMEPALAINY